MPALRCPRYDYIVFAARGASFRFFQLLRAAQVIYLRVRQQACRDAAVAPPARVFAGMLCAAQRGGAKKECDLRATSRDAQQRTQRGALRYLIFSRGPAILRAATLDAVATCCFDIASPRVMGTMPFYIFFDAGAVTAFCLSACHARSAMLHLPAIRGAMLLGLMRYAEERCPGRCPRVIDSILLYCAERLFDV